MYSESHYSLELYNTYMQYLVYMYIHTFIYTLYLLRPNNEFFLGEQIALIYS